MHEVQSWMQGREAGCGVVSGGCSWNNDDRMNE